MVVEKLEMVTGKGVQQTCLFPVVKNGQKTESHLFETFSNFLLTESTPWDLSFFKNVSESQPLILHDHPSRYLPRIASLKLMFLGQLIPCELWHGNIFIC